MRVWISGVVLQRIKSNKDIRLSTQVLDCMRDTWKENEAPSLFVRNNHFIDFALLTKAYQRRTEYRYRFPAFCMIVVAPHNSGKADNDMRISLRSKIFGRLEVRERNLADL